MPSFGQIARTAVIARANTTMAAATGFAIMLLTDFQPPAAPTKQSLEA